MTLLITGLLAVLCIGLLSRKRLVAINAADAPPDPAISVGLPKGVSSTAVAARKAALMAAGTPAIYAEKIAIDAEEQQAWHDAKPKDRAQAQMSQPGSSAEREAAAIAAAQKTEASKLAPVSEKQAEKRQDLVDNAASAAANVAGTTNKGGAASE